MQTLDHGARYDVKRAAGISKIRSDGSLTSRETDVQAGAAEQFAAAFFGAKFNSEIYTNHGDHGEDFILGEATVEVIHLGIKDGKPRMNGNLIVNPHEPQRWADIYVVVRGSIQAGFEIMGWYPHSTLVRRPMINFGYGLRYACAVRNLRPIQEIVDALSEET
jgi:hypothetical protein